MFTERGRGGPRITRSVRNRPRSSANRRLIDRFGAVSTGHRFLGHGAWCRMAAVLVSVAGFIVGFIVGLTGMGGGALMTPIMVLVFGVQPLAAVSSDLMASLVMKPVGAGVHMRHGAVNRRLVLFLCIGSVPAAFCGVLLLNALDTGEQFQNRLKTMLGIALLLAAASMIAKNLVDQRRGRKTITPVDQIRVRPVLTIAIGLFGGLMVGLTSVGSGLADHRPAAAALPDAVGQGPRRHRPRPGHPARRGRHPRPPPVRRLPARADPDAPGRRHPRRLPRGQGLHPGSRPDHPARADPGAADLRPQAPGRQHRLPGPGLRRRRRAARPVPRPSLRRQARRGAGHRDASPNLHPPPSRPERRNRPPEAPS